MTYYNECIISAWLIIKMRNPVLRNSGVCLSILIKFPSVHLSTLESIKPRGVGGTYL
jgi:hypothetical protein